ncbi:MAG TPA: hypothetical protein VGH93_08765, partial [Solirubrobacteraceae bacterium]
MVTVRSDPSVARVLREGRAHRARLHLVSEIGDQLRLTLRFAMHRVLQSLEQLLDVRDARFKRLEPIGLRIAR